MTRRLVVLDVDSTLIENEVIELLADEAGSREGVARVTDRAMRGEIDFTQSLRERVATLEGLDTAALERVREHVRVTRGVPDLIAAVHRAGGIVGVVSGGFHEILDPLAEDLGIDRWRANRLQLDAHGLLTGVVDGPIIDARAKAEALREWAEEWGISLSDTVAIGDGANDLEMMDLAAVSVAFCARPIVRDRADIRIDERDMARVIDALGL